MGGVKKTVGLKTVYLLMAGADVNSSQRGCLPVAFLSLSVTYRHTGTNGAF